MFDHMFDEKRILIPKLGQRIVLYDADGTRKRPAVVRAVGREGIDVDVLTYGPHDILLARTPMRLSRRDWARRARTPELFYGTGRGWGSIFGLDLMNGGLVLALPVIGALAVAGEVRRRSVNRG